MLGKVTWLTDGKAISFNRPNRLQVFAAILLPVVALGLGALLAWLGFQFVPGVKEAFVATWEHKVAKFVMLPLSCVVVLAFMVMGIKTLWSGTDPQE